MAEIEWVDPFAATLGKEQPQIKGNGIGGINPEWVIWYRARTRVSNNIAIRIGRRTLKERQSLLIGETNETA